MPALVKENRRWRERNHKEGSGGIAGNKPGEMREGVTKKYIIGMKMRGRRLAEWYVELERKSERRGQERIRDKKEISRVTGQELERE